VQKAAMPRILTGGDALVIGPTGHGKTEAAVLPLLSRLLELRSKGETWGIQLLYVTPLRALNRDLMERLTYWCEALEIPLGVRHGDTPQSERQRQKRDPPALLITTPESLGALLVSPELGEALRSVRFVVVDEVHELVDSKRGVQLSLSLERLRERCGGFQAVGLSATVGHPEEVARFLSPSAKVVEVRLPRGLDLSVDSPEPSSESKELAKLLRIPAGYASRVVALQHSIARSQSSLVFVNTRFAAESLGSLFFQIRELGETIGVHHSSLSKEARLEAEARFKGAAGEGERLKALICTSSLELGIDIGAIDLVVQYGSPRQVSRLLQRVGRSGHRRDRTPRGLVLSLDPLDSLEAGVICERALQGELEPTRIPRLSLDVLAHQLAGLCLDQPEVELAKALALFQKASPYRALTLDDVLEVARQMDSQGLLSLSPDGTLLQRTRRTLLYYYENLSTIPDERRFFVKDAGTRKNVALLDEGFVAEHLAPGVAFIARGKPWRVLSVSEDEVVVEASQTSEGAVPDWEGEEIPVEESVAQAAAEVLEGLCRGKLSEAGLHARLRLSPAAARELRSYAERQKPFFIPSPGELVVESRENLLVLHSFRGLRCNGALARALSFVLAGSLGSSVRVHATPYAVLFEFGGPAPVQKFERALRALRGAEFERFLRAGLTGTPLFRWRWTHVAKRFGYLRKDADLSGIGLRKLVENTRDSPLWREAFEELFFDDFDAAAAARLLEGLEAGSVDLTLLPPREKWSPLARSLLENGGLGELLQPQEPTEQLLAAFREHVLSQRSGLLCLYCGASWSREVRAHPEPVACPACGSSQVTTDEYREAAEKYRARKRLQPEERKRWEDALRVTSHIAAYGRKALAAFATYGVGPENASRVLSRLRASEREFFQDLYEAQVQFIRTRRFWKV
jgi:ATP-dependent Lhr-like helicase